MNHWKGRLYDSYVSSGQAAAHVDRASGLDIRKYPYYCHLIRTRLPKDRGISIADLACGHGALLFCLRELGYQNLQGVDISPEQVRLAHDLGVPGVRCLDLQTFLRDRRAEFDVLFLLDILEHLERPELLECMDLVSNALKPGGRVVLHVPNAAGPFGMRIRYGDLTHENSFTPQSLHQLMASCGIRAVDCFEDKPIVHGLKSLCRRILWASLTAPLRLLLLAETGTTGHIMSQNMLAVARKKDHSPRGTGTT